MPDLRNWPTPRLLSTAARLVEHAWNEALAALGLNHAGVIALQVLSAEGPMMQAQLAARARVRPQTMGRTLDRLEAHGHIIRVRNQIDGRSQQVRMSDLGKTALDQALNLERNLIPEGVTDIEELRNRLADIIRIHGSNRWDDDRRRP